MRRLVTWLVPLFLIACGEDQTANTGTQGTIGAGGATGATSSATGTGGATTGSAGTTGATSSSTGVGGGGTGGGDSLNFPGGDSSNEDATVDDLLSTTLVQPVQLTNDGTPVDITADDRIVFTTSDGLWSVKAAPGAPPRKVALVPGNVHVRGRTIFNFANVDWQTNEGDLTFWTPKIGRRSVGKAMIGDNRVAARDDAAYVLFARDLRADTQDIVVSSADTEHAHILVDDAGRGDMDTCGPNFGFAGDAVIASWCSVGTDTATLARFTVNQEGQWTKEVISDSAQGFWSSDTTGEHLFYITSDGQGWVLDANGKRSLGQGVGWGKVHPQGQAVFFSVADQLRRSDLKSSAIPVVVDGFQQAVAWTADLTRVLYSSKIVYDAGTQQDLRTTPTQTFNATPTILVAQPVATLGRSSLTTDGLFALYLRDVTNAGGTLHVRATNGPGAWTFPKVDTVLAAWGSAVLFTDNRSNDGSYPVLADLKVLAAGSGIAPHVLEAGIDDGRNIQVTADKGRVAFRRPAGADTTGGIWVRNVE